MSPITKAALFFEPNEALSGGVRPLSLETIQGQPVLYWTFRALFDNGATRFFVAAPPDYGEEIRACLPSGASATVSDRQDALMAFLDGPEFVAVLPRAALPMPQIGAGFAYAASGDSLRKAWAVRLTNAVQDAELLPGWVPLYDRDTLQEIQPHFQPEAAP